MQHRVLFLTLALGGACRSKDALPPVLLVSPTSVDLGDVPIDTTAEGIFTLSNSGGGSLDILSVTLVDGDSDLWRLDRASLNALGEGESVVVTARFSPEEEGEEPARVQVRSSDDDAGAIYVDLLATGTASTADDDGDGVTPADGDCDDGDGSVYPGATEACDGKDNNCDGVTPSDESDADYDGARVCEDDCDDADEDVYPGAPEICDEKDSDCDGVSADHDDLDGDGYAVCDDDCDDDDRKINPGAAEICDEIDNDCSGAADDVDADGDGHTLCGGGDCDDDDASAYPVVVDSAAGDGGDGTDEAPYNSVEDALDALDDTCRTVILLPGDYTLTVSWSDDSLTIEGLGEADEIVLSPEEEGDRVLDISGGAEVTLRSLTLAGAVATGDGGVARVSGADLILDGVIARDNTCTGDGGVVSIRSGTLTVTASDFEGNSASDDGGVLALVSATLIDEDGSMYADNSAVRGGALIAESSDVFLYDASFWRNVSEDTGGAVAFTRLESLEMLRGTLALNQANTSGGAISLSDVDVPEGAIRNLFIQDNSAGTVGGGVAFTGSVAGLLFANNTLTGNRAADEGGGLYVNATDASRLDVWSDLVIASYGDSGLYSSGGADVAWCTAYLSASGAEFAGEASAGTGENTEENPVFVTFSNDGDPSNDDLDLDSRSPVRDAGPTDSALNDTDGTRNDRGATGGPEAL